MIKISSRWTDINGKLFIVDNVQDGVIWYHHGENNYSCLEGAFLERFRELVNNG